MGKIVIKTIKNGNAAKIEIRDFEEIDTAIMTICAFVKIISGLNRESKEIALYAAGIILKGITNKTDSEPGEELENMDSLQAAKISLAMFAGTTMALAKQGRRVECAIAMDAARQILDKLSKDVSK